ncbi:MAG TPA: FapA family protein [Spirochaetales bacterium]|nr:FapA family protein [Spirochaetales bacterium]HRY56048.1 FapA family protein [Spirochaetia bacterium]HRZ64772.1 FapA family protein [Spirochaetia bacterium]
MGATLGIDQIAELMRRYLEEDGAKKSIVVEADSVEEALADAAVQLGVTVRRLEYEILEKGSPGLLGAGRRPWKVKASPQAEKREVAAAAADDLGGESLPEAVEPLVKDRDGECFVRLTPDGALLKVTAPLGKGRRAQERQAIDKLHARAVRSFDEALVREVIKQASSDYVRVGDFISNPANDALITVDLGDQEMKAFVTMTPPGPGGSDLSKDAILSFLRNNRVVHGVLEEVLQELEDKPRYREAVLVAEGTRPQNGRDSTVQFSFETDKTKYHLKEAADGRVNFKELGLIQNVVAGQPLARKLPPELGQTGRTVTGKVIPARNGKDMAAPLGRNVHMGDDGSTIIADINGQVIFVGGKINVEEIFTVPGDVDLKTGNIMFLGTVIVQGNVEDGFSVKASGNIEVRGNVGKCDLIAEGDIVVHQGVTGKSGGVIQAGKSIWAKFIENASVEAGENVIVSDGIINSTVVANKKIICQGKRAAIVGGRYRACEEINAKTLGSPVGSAETIVEVGYDPKSKEKMDQLQAQVYRIKRQVEELDKNIATLNAIKKQKKELPEDKEAILQDYLIRREEQVQELRALAKEIEAIQTYLNGLKSKGRISASGRIYPGVKLVIKDVKEEIKNEQKAMTFYLEGQMFRTTRYEEPEDDILRRGPPDAHKAD